MVVEGVTDVCNATFCFLIRPVTTVRVHLGLVIDAKGFPDVQKVGFRSPKVIGAVPGVLNIAYLG